MNIIIRNKRIYKGSGEIIHRASPKGQVKGSPLGNPFHLKDESERDNVIQKYRIWLWNHIKAGTPEIVNELLRLYNLALKQDELNLICFCAPKACHGDVIINCIYWMEKQKKVVLCSEVVQPYEVYKTEEQIQSEDWRWR